MLISKSKKNVKDKMSEEVLTSAYTSTFDENDGKFQVWLTIFQVLQEWIDWKKYWMIM